MTAPLRLVREREDTRIDIQALQLADIRKRDWSRVMIEGDKQKPVVLGDRVRRTWL